MCTDDADLGYDFARASEMGIVIVGPSDVRLPSFSCDAVDLSPEMYRWSRMDRNKDKARPLECDVVKVLDCVKLCETTVPF